MTDETPTDETPIVEDEDIMDDTNIVIDNTTSQTIQTPVYEFTITGKTHPDYQCCASIIEWIKTNLEALKDDYNKSLFSKVNYGYNQDTLKGFGKKPVADVYIDHLTYTTDFDNNQPETVTSFIICYLKGNMNNAYMKACELTDYLVQQFEENDDFRELTDIVRDTRVAEVQLEILPGAKSYGIVCGFELEHKLY